MHLHLTKEKISSFTGMNFTGQKRTAALLRTPDGTRAAQWFEASNNALKPNRARWCKKKTI